MSWYGDDFYKKLDRAEIQYDYIYGDDTFDKLRKERLARDFEDCYDRDDDSVDNSDEGFNCD